MTGMWLDNFIRLIRKALWTGIGLIALLG
jgi:hypothetical protein